MHVWMCMRLLKDIEISTKRYGAIDFGTRAKSERALLQQTIFSPGHNLHQRGIILPLSGGNKRWEGRGVDKRKGPR
ncbi:hypothetical protein PoB_001470600 [Plakobranchus ocellatus]|uniref:Uncharacterized protein n=1 Tax=Plakobranchus ocellatus TaxID=259542 RepID=A0AAV3YXG7_9GAST|nr:hypothetical protein PoB_001470600 [Plakobranchus ocellatus]